MERMEQERAEMIAEVEAQIESALASMAVDMDDSDYGGSRPSSRLSSRSAPTTMRRSGSRARLLRSFSTDSTLTDLYAAGAMREEMIAKNRRTSTVPEVEEPIDDNEAASKRRKRFSASHLDAPQDGMSAVDEGISQKSDSIAQKVLDIQRKVSIGKYNI
jgi:EEF1A N-terminal glycine/lysine methyltransferase